MGFIIDDNRFVQSTYQYLGPPRTEVQSTVEVIDDIRILIIETDVSLQDLNASYHSILPSHIWLKIPYGDHMIGEEIPISNSESCMSIADVYYDDGENWPRTRNQRLAFFETLSAKVLAVGESRARGVFEATLRVEILNGPNILYLTDGIFNVEFTGGYNYETWKGHQLASYD